MESLAGRWMELSEVVVHREVPARAPWLCEGGTAEFLRLRTPGGDFGPPPTPRHQPNGTVNNRPPVPDTTPPESPPLTEKLRHGEEK